MQELQKNATLNQIPRIIMTTSDEKDDIERCASFGFLDHIVKPPDYDQVLDMLHHAKVA